MKGTVYLSYSGRNCEAVLQVMEHIIRGGYALVCDCMLPASESFEGRVSRGVTQADLVAAVITEDAKDCPYMARELEIAFVQKKRVLPVVVGEAQLPDAFTLRLQNCISVSDFPTEAEMAAVMAGITKQCGRE
ncbi:MAG: toll/interleukin-1 receptor domain-containing protein [Oscillospiraceae bacterium]|nr:toll/interleukin-1 receptor domain-containing protein [Oscillospiraceae bacterium]